MNCNKKRFSKAKGSEVFKGKIHGNIIENDARDKILNGELNREDFDEESAFKFLSSLKK